MSITATAFTVPTRESVSPANQGIFDQLKKGLGMVPNLYATIDVKHEGRGLVYLTCAIDDDRASFASTH